MAKGDRVGVYNANGKNGIDNREVAGLAHDIRDASFAIQAKAEGVVKRGAVNIKRDAREIVQRARSENTSIPAYPFSISFSMISKTEASIGPSRRGNKNQAKLGNLLEYGSAFNAPIPHLQPALDKEAPRFSAHLADEAGDML